MIVVYCPDERLWSRLAAAVPALHLERARNWPTFATATPRCECAAVIVHRLAGHQIVEQLEGWRIQFATTPLVVATQKDADNLRLLRRVSIDEIVWTAELEQALPAAVVRVRQASLLQGLAARLGGMEALPRRLRDSLVALFRADAPVRTLDELAALVASDRRTLWRLWRTSGPPTVRLQDLLDWNLLLRASILRPQRRSWQEVGVDLAVHEHTLARTAKRLTGLSLRQLAARGAPGLGALLEARVVAPLLEPRQPSAAS